LIRTKYLCGAVLWLVCSVCGRAEAAGETALVSREFDQWPSTAAMGSTAASSLDPLTALWVNPAALAFSAGQIGATHIDWIGDTRMEQLALALGGTRRVRLGLSSHLVTTDDIQSRTGPTAPLGDFEVRDFGFGMSAAMELGPSWALGLTARFLRQQVFTDDASTIGFDVGVMWLQSSRLRLGASVNNLGSSLSWGDILSVPLPRSFRAGGSFKIGSTLMVAGDVWSIRDRDARGTVGVEWQPTPVLLIRSGYLAGSDSRNISAGFGLNWREIGFDYAIVPLSNDLGVTHRVGIRYVPSLRR
jgi:hypothetical protein